ncbi:HAMP domain-containing sensor histidine kinase [Paracoccus sp. JM45]|uniref:HAMP domain-containing sensor histidine kinase n=1 Tax=Paracoccus sp. JM45 TaxID=2283626 RepID=UPI000E6CE4B6|nr:HAMP domain-containing sensor histidine kinase [Paracoccus sp. JM45]RJE78948.1 sensor histidine kinase [Paracoccus sp. JM45]
MFLNQLTDLKRLYRMSALRQAATITLTFLVLMFVAGSIAVTAFEHEWQIRIEDELTSRFAEVRDDINRFNFDPTRYPLSKNERIEFRTSGPTIKSGMYNTLDVNWRFGDSPSTAVQDAEWLDDPSGKWMFMVGNVKDGQLIVGTDLRRQDDFLQIMLRTMGFVGLGAAISALLIGIYLGLRTQRRISAMALTLSNFGAGNLTARMGQTARQDDLADLSRQLDATLSQLNSLIRQSRDFASNIAHDLRTPLTRLRIRLDRALYDETSSKEHVEAAMSQTDSIIEIFDAFLRIAKLETGTARATFLPIDLGKLADEIAQIYGPVIESSGRVFVTDIHSSITIRGDRVLLIQLMANLLENAIRHTPDGCTIRLIAKGQGIGVADDGPGIPPEEFTRITQPLYRLECSRKSEGVGLGLSLAKTIAEIHSGKLEFANNKNNESGTGLLVQVTLPSIS